MNGIKQLAQYLFGMDEADVGQEEIEQVECALEKLSADDKTLISKRYGIGEDRQYSFKELAAMFGKDWEWVYQNESRILHTLQSEIDRFKNFKTKKK